MTAYLKTLNVVEASGLYMRVYDEFGDISMDTMKNRVVRGSTEWHQYKIVLDVPLNSVVIDFGVWLQGKGEARVDCFTFQTVDSSEEVTGDYIKRKYRAPDNLSFESSGAPREGGTDSLETGIQRHEWD
jgi:hypothetical protein